MPIQLLVIVAAISALVGGTVGYKVHKSFTDAELVEQLAEAHKNRDEALKLNDELSRKLSEAEGSITTRTVEVVKYVPKVTTGKPCLSSDAVGLLQPTGNQGATKTDGKSDDKGAEPLAASDRDVAYWIAEANRLYDVCAERQHSLIDYVEGVQHGN